MNRTTFTMSIQISNVGKDDKYELFQWRKPTACPNLFKYNKGKNNCGRHPLHNILHNTGQAVEERVGVNHICSLITWL